MTCLLCPKYDQKFRGGGGVLPEKLVGGVRHTSWNPCPISDQNLWFSLPYFRPNTLEPGAWLERVTSCYGTYTIVGVNTKREMVLLPNNNEVAYSSKRYTQFKTKVHKPYPISDQNGRNWYPISDQKRLKNHNLWHGTFLYSLYKGQLIHMHAYLSLSDVNVRHDLRFLLLLSFILHSMCGTPQIKLPILMTKNIDLRHQYGISGAEAQIFLLVKHNWQRRIRGVSCFHKLNQEKAACFLVYSINQSNKFLYSSSFLLFQFCYV